MNAAVKGTIGIFTEFARSRRVQQNTVILVKFPSIDDFGEASKLVGRWVAWTSQSGHKLRGKIVAAHGKNGVVRARFEHGLPSQAIGARIALE